MTLKLELTNDLSELSRLADSLERFAAEHRLLPKTRWNLDLVLEELFTNIVRHAFDDDQPQRIGVRVESDGGHLTVVIEDSGKPFNPLDYPPADCDLLLEERRVGGVGIHLVRRLSEAAAYVREGGRNVVMVRLSAGAGPPTATSG